MDTEAQRDPITEAVQIIACLIVTLISSMLLMNIESDERQIGFVRSTVENHGYTLVEAHDEEGSVRRFKSLTPCGVHDHWVATVKTDTGEERDVDVCVTRRDAYFDGEPQG